MGALVFAVLAAPPHPLEIFTEADANGDPIVYATGSHAPVFWQACLGSDCRSFQGDAWHPGETAAGTVFTAYASGEGASVSGWRGRIAATSAPALGGNAVVGGTVWPVAAVWSGGWSGELDDLRVEAGKAATGRTLSAPDWVSGERDGAVVLGPDVAGWSLHVADRRRNRLEVRPQIFISDPGEVPPLNPGPLVAVSPSTDVAAPTVSAPDVKPGAPPLIPGPLVALRKRASRTRSGVVVGSAACPQRCTLRLTVSDGRHRFTRTLSGRGVIALTLARSAKPRRGTLRVKVSVNGRAAASARLPF